MPNCPMSTALGQLGRALEHYNINVELRVHRDPEKAVLSARSNCRRRQKTLLPYITLGLLLQGSCLCLRQSRTVFLSLLSQIRGGGGAFVCLKTKQQCVFRVETR